MGTPAPWIWILGEITLVLEAKRSCHHQSAQGKQDSSGLRGVSMQGTPPGVPTPTQSSLGTETYSGSRDQLASRDI